VTAAYRPDPQTLADASLTSEAAFQVRVVELATRLGWHAYHTHDARRSEPGLPDLLLVRGARLVFIELKVGRRQLTPEQERWIRELDDVTEVDAIVVRGRHDGRDDFTDLERFLARRARPVG
jgi:VRR-NUC domain